MPRSPYQVVIIVDSPYRDRVRSRSLAGLIRRTLASERVPGPLCVSTVITNDRTVRSLNRRFRGEDSATDVLSFGLEDPGSFVALRGPRQLGEIVISFSMAVRQAREAGYSVQDELAHLAVHGVLHLLGYDHERRRDATVMRACEEAILGREAH